MMIQDRFKNIIEHTRVIEDQHELCRDILGELKLALFKLKIAVDITVFGSYSRETAINKSDFDVLLCLLFDIKEYSPKSLMNYLLNRLKTHFESPNYHLYIDFPAIVLEKKGLEVKFDLIPCSTIEPLIGDNKEVLIALDEYNYMRINPDYQNKYIFGLLSKNGYGKSKNSANIKKSINVTTKLFKYWKSCYQLNFNIPSFYFETILSNAWKGIRNNSIQDDFTYAFAVLNHLAQSNLVIDQYAKKTNTETTHPKIKNREVVELINRTFNYCKLAMQHEYSGNIDKSIGYWQIVFNNNFLDFGTRI